MSLKDFLTENPPLPPMTPEEQMGSMLYRQTVELRARIQLIHRIIKDLGLERKVSREFNRISRAEYEQQCRLIAEHDAMQAEYQERNKPRIIVPGEP